MEARAPARRPARRGRWPRWVVFGALLAAAAAVAGPAVIRAWWSARSTNPVRRGVALARELGCFSCHGDLGANGVGDPLSRTGEVPSWGGGEWMMYVHSDDDVRRYILHGGLDEPSGDGDPAAADEGGAVEQAIEMPAYRDRVDNREVDDLVATFKVLSRMTQPPADSAERRGRDLADRWRCFGCHGAAGSGGLPNPGSFTGFIPGWYGADFEDLVRDRTEFDAWIRDGSIARLSGNPVAAWFLRRQRIDMPLYEAFTDAQLDDLWAYTRWLAATDGGHAGVPPTW